MKCPDCGAEMTSGSKFCGNCGARLDAPEAAPVQKMHSAETVVGTPAPRRLVVTLGPNKGQAVDLGVETRIGRETDNQLVLLDPRVSRYHAIVRWRNGEYVVEDLKSANGVAVNGERISEPRTLHDGDKLTLGDTELLFARISDDSSTVRDTEKADEFESAEKTPVRPQPVPAVETRGKVDVPPPPGGPEGPPTVPSSEAVREAAAPVAAREEKRGGAGEWLLLTCGLLILLFILLALTILFTWPTLRSM